MLIIVKSDTNRIFGGYTPIALKRGGVRKQDGTSFLFSIRDNNEVVKCAYREGTDEIHQTKTMLIAFTNTLWIHKDCNQNNYSNLIMNAESSFMPPSELDPESKEALYYLNHGVQMFRVLELEIYSLQ